MALFQISVLKKFLQEMDNKSVSELYSAYSQYFLNPNIQQNIRDSKEEQFQEGFLRELFVNVLGYTINPNPNYNLTTELKNETGTKKADGAIIKDGKAIGVIELKSTTTRDLESIRQQAFDYKANQSECVYVVTSNFEKLRFYIDNAVEYEEFDLFTLSLEQFRLLYLCLHVDCIMSGLAKKAKTESLVKEENITQKLYADYSTFKKELFNDIISKDENIEVVTGNIATRGCVPLSPNGQEQPATRGCNPLSYNNKARVVLFKKTQKLLDRFLFILFSEDRELLPPNAISTILKEWKQLKSLNAYVPLYTRFKNYFEYINTGWKGDNYEVFAYNGGLFSPDEILDNITISDDLLYNYTDRLTKYDFASEVDVNILGHIFEHSLNEIEAMNAELEGQAIDIRSSKRKKDGIYYTPKYITKYIADNTIGRLCDDKKQELSIIEDDYRRGKKGRKKSTVKNLETKLIDYRNWLLGITIVDPACGSGAFLNQALEFLISEHRWIDVMTAELFGGGLVFQDVENSILENNLYGVDINEESVEIAKLSLWLRTAKKGRKLTSLNSNIKCGNSLIDDPKVAGEKAFSWVREFPKVFPEKQKRAFHIIWVTHNARASQRMIDHNVDKNDGVWLTEEMEVEITKTIIQVVEEDQLNVMAYNICGDHVHILLVCEEEEVSNIVRKLKGKSSQKLKEYMGVDRNEKFTLWAQKFSQTHIKDNEQLSNTILYITNNRTKHNLGENKGLQPLVANKVGTNNRKGLQPPVEYQHPLCCSYDYAFRPEYKGGFDVVIGNPPYGALLDADAQRWLINRYIQGGSETAISFIKLGYELLSQSGRISFIVPKSFSFASNYSAIREFLLSNLDVIADCKKVWQEVKLEQIIFVCSKSGQPYNYKSIIRRDQDFVEVGEIQKTTFKQFGLLLNGISDEELAIGEKLISNRLFLNDIATNARGGMLQKYLEKTGEFAVLGGTEIQRYGTVGVKGYVDRQIIENDNKAQVSNNSVLVQNIVAHIENPTDHIKITACLPDEKNIAIVDTVNQIIPTNPKIRANHIWALLNSVLINWFAYHFIYGKAIRTMHFDSPVTSRIPIPNLNNSSFDKIIKESEQVIKDNKDLTEKSANFLNFLQSKYEIDQYGKNLKEWYNLNFKQFLSELVKKKVRLSLSEEEEWLHYFEQKKAEAQELIVKIEKTNNEIDLIVYRLYALTYDEVLIVDPETSITREAYDG